MRVRNPVELGALLRERRRQLGLSQAEVAARAGLGRPVLVALEKGKGNPQLRNLLRLLEVLQLPLSVGDLPRASRTAVPPVQERLNLEDHLTLFERT